MAIEMQIKDVDGTTVAMLVVDGLWVASLHWTEDDGTIVLGGINVAGTHQGNNYGRILCGLVVEQWITDGRMPPGEWEMDENGFRSGDIGCTVGWGDKELCYANKIAPLVNPPAAG